MTAYNGMYRCSGGQQPPARVRGWKGECPRCGRWLKRYPNGRIVMHKTLSAAVMAARAR